MKGKLFKYWNRAENGPMMTEKDFDLKVYWPKLQEVVKKYKIEYNPDEVVPQSVELADNIFKAARELFLECGVFCTSSERVIKFEESELNEMLDRFPSETVLGEGKDAVKITHRGLNPKEPPHTLGRVLGPQDAKIIDQIFYSYASELRLDHCQFQGIIPEIHGIKMKAGTAHEMAAEIKRIACMEQARKRAGRPGLSDGASSPVTLQAALVGYNSESGMRKGDVRHVYIMPHLKTSYEQFTRTFAIHQFGANLWGLGQAFVGGLAGSPAMAAVVCTAELFAYCLLYNPTYLGIWPADAIYFATTSKTALWANFHCGAAWSNNTKTFAVTGAPWGIVASGPCTDTYFWEHAAATIGNAVVGLNVSGGTGWQSGRLNGATPIGARFASEVGQAVCEAQIDWVEANRLVKYCLDKYQDRMVARTLHEGGKRWDQCYDVETCEPTQEYLDIYNKVKQELRDQGLTNLR